MLHKYVITDAIKDENVLKFAAEYVGRFKQKEIPSSISKLKTSTSGKPWKIPSAWIRLWITSSNAMIRKTHHKDYSGDVCRGGIDTLIKYYLFQQKKDAGEHDLRIATIFTYGANEEDKGATGLYRSRKTMSLELLPNP